MRTCKIVQKLKLWSSQFLSLVVEWTLQTHKEGDQGWYWAGPVVL